MQLVDHLFVVLLFVVQPIHGALSYGRYIARIKAGAASDRVHLYKQTLALEWVALAVLATTWYLLGRPVADLGFVSPEGSGFFIGAGILLLAVGVLVQQWRNALTASDDDKVKQREAFGTLVHFMPQNERDYRYFFGLSITAGIVEEILYRGFAIWYLALVMPVWAAIVVSAIAFGLGHSYQGVGGVARVTLIGLAFGAFYVFTGSIWLPMLAHALLDILQGATILSIMRHRV
jgi:membrane protease YdiL (CAAX protease family)